MLDVRYDIVANLNINQTIQMITFLNIKINTRMNCTKIRKVTMLLVSRNAGRINLVTNKKLSTIYRVLV